MHKSCLIAILLMLLIVVSLLTTISFCAALVVGVKQGDWIKYQSTEKGTPIPEYNITWAKMNIISVQGETITVNIVTAFGNGTLFPENGINLNLATGAIGDGFFIPLNLTVGDKYSTEYEGIVNITNVEQIKTAGAERTVLVGVSSQSTYYWDKQTGIMVAATSNLPGCTMYTTTSATNLWAPQILGLDQNLFFEVTASLIAVIAVLVVALLLFWRSKKSSASPNFRQTK
jgi:hypothetical protein